MLDFIEELLKGAMVLAVLSYAICVVAVVGERNGRRSAASLLFNTFAVFDPRVALQKHYGHRFYP